jgi:Fe-S-cluster containining protein
VVNEVRLKELQDLFECQKCGHCCIVGGVVPLTAKDVQRLGAYLSLRSHGLKRCSVQRLRVVEELYVFGTESPCPRFDSVKCECSIYGARPSYCADYPFLSLLSGYSTIDDIVYCPGALKVLSEYLGVVPFKLEVK